MEAVQTPSSLALEPRDEELLREAIDMAHESMLCNQGGPFGAVIVRDGEIIGRGTNLVTSSLDPTAHAEMVAIRDACQNIGNFKLDEATIYTSCEPCPMCLAGIYWARIGRIVYACTRKDAANIGFDDDHLYQQIPLAPEDRDIPMTQAMRHAGLVPFDEWREKLDRTPY